MREKERKTLKYVLQQCWLVHLQCRQWSESVLSQALLSPPVFNSLFDVAVLVFLLHYLCIFFILFFYDTRNHFKRKSKQSALAFLIFVTVSQASLRAIASVALHWLFSQLDYLLMQIPSVILIFVTFCVGCYFMLLFKSVKGPLRCWLF